MLLVQLVSMNVSYSVITGKTLFSVKVYRYFDGFSNRHVARFFESVLKEVRILRYLLNTVTV